MAAILVVDDEKSITFLLSEVLKKDGHSVRQLSDGKLVADELKKHSYDLVVSDMHMKEVGGIEVLKIVKGKDKSTEVLILTGHGTVATAVEAMKLGAFEYLTKPIDMEEFRLKVQKALERRQFKLQIERQQQELLAYQEMIKKDLGLAEQVQRSLVPQPISLPGVDVHVKYLPMIGVGGDFADVYFDGAENVYLNLVDVTGHGITAALMVNRICSEIRKLVREHLQPQTILFHVNNFILQTFEGMAMFLTMFSGVINLRTGTFTYAGSAHPAAILWRSRENKFQRLESQNVILGYDKRKENNFLQESVRVGPEDKIILYTDGIIEAEDGSGRQLGIDGFINFFKPAIYRSANEIIESILNGVYQYSPHSLKDDVYLIIAGMK
jgi:sigma-B regulation protein RsbU (phosphoserine phosphatase)